MNKHITITKVVTKNFIIDFISSVQNMFGMNLNYYENMINKGTEKIQTELKEKNIQLKWYRYEITQLTNGAMAIMLYGETR